MSTLKILGSLLLLSLSLAVRPATAAPHYSQMVVFGDSLSDSGIFHAQFDGKDPYTSVSGRFSNGSVAAERLAADLGIGAANFHDYAVGGALSGTGNLAYSDPLILGNSELKAKLAAADLPGMSSQAGRYLASHAVDPSALYLVWGGANDISSLLAQATVSAADIGKLITDVVGNLGGIIRELIGSGAKHVLAPNLPDMGRTPEVRAYGPLIFSEATQISRAFDQAYAQALDQIDAASPGVVVRFDVLSLLETVSASPQNFGFANVTDACLLSSACLTEPASWNSYLFWDQIHPSSGGHAILGDAFSAALGVPEPEVLPLLWAAVLAAGIMLWRRR